METMLGDGVERRCENILIEYIQQYHRHGKYHHSFFSRAYGVFSLGFYFGFSVSQSVLRFVVCFTSNK